MDSTTLKDLGLYKNYLLNMIIQSDDIKDAMFVDKNKESKKHGNLNQLIYKQIFPYLYVDETQTEVLPYICIEDDIPRVPTSTVKNMQLTIWAYAHKDCMQYDYYNYSGDYIGDRPDALCDMIDRIIMSEENYYSFGIGKPELKSVGHLFPQNKYYGRQLIYEIPDFKSKKVKKS